jgi:hypothetical protein
MPKLVLRLQNMAAALLRSRVLGARQAQQQASPVGHVSLMRTLPVVEQPVALPYAGSLEGEAAAPRCLRRVLLCRFWGLAAGLPTVMMLERSQGSTTHSAHG